jgi:1,4-alpha-glucan branching enzyme
MFAFPGKKLLFMGAEFGQWDEWDHEKSLDWHLLQWDTHQGIHRWMQDLLRVYRQEQSLYEIDFHYSGFEWIDFHDSAGSVISFERKAQDPSNAVVVTCNFTPVPRHGYRIGVRQPGNYRELLSSDSSYYGGSNMGNGGGITSEPIPQHGREHSLSLTLPPLAVLLLKRE